MKSPDIAHTGFHRRYIDVGCGSELGGIGTFGKTFRCHSGQQEKRYAPVDYVRCGCGPHLGVAQGGRRGRFLHRRDADILKEQFEGATGSWPTTTTATVRDGARGHFQCCASRMPDLRSGNQLLRPHVRMKERRSAGIRGARHYAHPQISLKQTGRKDIPQLPLVNFVHPI